MPLSLRTKIVAFYMLVLLVLLPVLGAILYFSLEKIVFASLDASLRSRAAVLADLTSEEDEDTDAGLEGDDLWEYRSPQSRFYFQVMDSRGKILRRSASLGSAGLPPHAVTSDRITFATLRWQGRPIRLCSMPVYPSGRQRQAGRRIIQCAEDIHGSIHLLDTYRNALALAILCILAVSSAGGMFIASRALAPVREISRAVDRISASRLEERLSLPDTPRELRPLAASFNRTFAGLEKAFARQRQFISDASHELRTPVAVILSQSEITRRKKRTPREYDRALGGIQGAAQYMAGIVKKLATLARLDDESPGLQRERVELRGVVQKARTLLEPLAAEREVGLELAAPEPLFVTGDPAYLLELMVNLVTNAVTFNHRGGKVRMTCRPEDFWATVEISDTGIGIPEADLPRIFERFYRADPSRSRETGGSGLGLSICQEIVQAHAGRIEMRSTVGSGTTVKIFLRSWKA